MIPFIQVKSTINKKFKACHAYLRTNCGQNFHGSDKMEQRKDRHYQMISSRELLPCVPLSFLSSYGKSLYNVFFV